MILILGWFLPEHSVTYVGDWEAEHTIVQHFVNPFNDGATLGFNFNEDIDNFQLGSCNQYDGANGAAPGALKHLFIF